MTTGRLTYGAENSMKAKPLETCVSSSTGMYSPPSRIVPICDSQLTNFSSLLEKKPFPLSDAQIRVLARYA